MKSLEAEGDRPLPSRTRIFFAPVGFLERSKDEKIRKCTDKQAKTV